MKVEIKQRGLATVLKFNAALEGRVIEAASTGLKRGLAQAVTIAQREYLSGPRPAKLDARTGRLRQAMTWDVRLVPGRGVIGRIGNNVKYARFHEFGFHGVQNVAAHIRITKQLSALGVAIDTRRVLRRADGTVIGFRDSRQTAVNRAGGGVGAIAQVRAHTRKIAYDGRPFARPALKRATPLILAAIKQELKKV